MAENKDEQLTDEELAQLQLAEESENAVDRVVVLVVREAVVLWTMSAAGVLNNASCLDQSWRESRSPPSNTDRCGQST